MKPAMFLKQGDPVSFAETIKKITHESGEKIKDTQERAYSLATGEYSWTSDAARLLAIYQ